MRLLYLVHIIGGTLGLLAGYTALFSVKGAVTHRRSGMVFVYAMLAMCAAGAFMAIRHGVWMEVNVPAALLTAYLVITSLTTVRPLASGGRQLTIGLMLVGLTIGLMCLAFGAQAIANGGRRNGIPAFPFLMFGVVGTLGAVLDLRLLRVGTLTGAARLTRHLWRITFALFIAAMSFFIGQADVFPKPIRIPALLAMPVLAVLVSLLYWLWRVRVNRSLRGLVGIASPGLAG